MLGLIADKNVNCTGCGRDYRVLNITKQPKKHTDVGRQDIVQKNCYRLIGQPAIEFLSLQLVSPSVYKNEWRIE